jgi:MarR family transcriptional regulator, transcriptional regulator for hemolysin
MTFPEQVGSLRRTLHRLVGRRLSGRTRRPFSQLLALKFIDRLGVRTQAELAERLLIDAPGVSRLVDRLEDEGLVKRCAGEDRRCVRLQVSEAGREEIVVLDEADQWVQAEANKYLTAAEMRELMRLLVKLQAGLSQVLEESERESA